jgi:hypothetical protein
MGEALFHREAPPPPRPGPRTGWKVIRFRTSLRRRGPPPTPRRPGWHGFLGVPAPRMERAEHDAHEQPTPICTGAPSRWSMTALPSMRRAASSSWKTSSTKPGASTPSSASANQAANPSAPRNQPRTQARGALPPARTTADPPAPPAQRTAQLGCAVAQLSPHPGSSSRNHCRAAPAHVRPAEGTDCADGESCLRAAGEAHRRPARSREAHAGLTRASDDGLCGSVFDKRSSCAVMPFR